MTEITLLKCAACGKDPMRHENNLASTLKHKHVVSCCSFVSRGESAFAASFLWNVLMVNNKGNSNEQ